MTKLESKLIEIFKERKGRERAISREFLVTLTGESDRAVRATIAELRGLCYPIVSLQKGYYWAIGEDLINYIKREESRAKTVLRNISRLKKRPLPAIKNQMSLFETEL